MPKAKKLVEDLLGHVECKEDSVEIQGSRATLGKAVVRVEKPPRGGDQVSGAPLSQAVVGVEAHSRCVEIISVGVGPFGPGMTQLM